MRLRINVYCTANMIQIKHQCCSSNIRFIQKNTMMLFAQGHLEATEASILPLKELRQFCGMQFIFGNVSFN